MFGRRRRRRLRRARTARPAGPACQSLEARLVMAAATPVITEFLASNTAGLTDADGNATDWVEIHNPTAASVNLAGWSLSDDAAEPAKWTFPSTPLAAGARLVVFASGKDRATAGQQLHTSFELDADGEFLGLFPPASAATVSRFDPYPAQATDVSYGLLESDPAAERFFTTPTPGAANGDGTAGVVGDTKWSVDRGFFDAPFPLEITTDLPGAAVRYTTDGSPPSPTSGTLYTGPITIAGTTVVRAIGYRDGYLPTNVDTQTYLFLDQVVRQPKDIPGWPKPAMGVDNSTTNTRVHDYEMDPDVVNNPAYAAAIRKGLTDIPTMSLVVRQSDMWDSSGRGGFYRSADVEKPVSVEVIYPHDPDKSIQTDAGIEGHSYDRLKRSLRLKFKPEYGDAKFDTDLLQGAAVNGGSAVDEFETLVLRAGNQRSWARNFHPDKTTYTEDQWFRDTQIAMSGVGSHGAFVHLYVNGLYWGLYNPSERPDSDFAAAYYPGGDDDWFTVKEDGVWSGDPTRWNYLKGALKNKDMATLASYRELEGYLDTAQFADYLLLQWYAGNIDWPRNNWWAANSRLAGGTTKFFAWDGEWAEGVSNGSPGKAWVHPEFRKAKTKNGAYDIANLFNAAKASKEFLTLLADRAYRAAYNGGALSDAAALARFDALNDQVRDAVIAESARWGDAITPTAPRTRDGAWQNEVARMRNYITGNAADLIAALRAEGYYPSNNPATLSKRGGTVAAGYKLTMSNPNGNGTIYYTTNGADPRAAGGGVSSAAKVYPGGGVTLSTNTRVRVRIRSSAGVWSAGDDLQFTVTNTTSAPVIGTQPAHRTVTVGQSATFSVAATGATPMSFQWQRDGTNIPGATSASYTLTNAQLNDSNANFRVVITNGVGTTTSAAAKLTVTAVPAPKSGLSATYFNNADFTGSSLGRVDAGVSFNWGAAAPAPGIGADTFSVRWVGKVTPPTTGSYTFAAQVNDGVRLWVNGQQVINQWSAAGPVKRVATPVTLTGGVAYDIRLEYFENLYDASCRLLWTGPGLAEQTVPSSALSPA